MFLCPSQFPSGTLVTGAGSKAFGTKRARFISSPPLLRQKLSLPNKRTRSCRSLSPTPHLPDKEHEPPPRRKPGVSWLSKARVCLSPAGGKLCTPLVSPPTDPPATVHCLLAEKVRKPQELRPFQLRGDQPE